uniref:Laminin subunit beta-1 n=1 Tax=Astyanax mexicanus TaxID=7994 RepID=A0A8B9L4Q4_ASTMX
AACNCVPFVHSVAQELPSSPHGCTDGSCYPATGNLLIGRAVNLTATSTCGLESPEQYCIVSHLQVNQTQLSEVIHIHISTQESVSIRLNLEAEFHFTHLIMKFKTFRPAGMLIERSADFGRSWRPYRYFAYNCTRTFPRVPARSLQLIDDVICEERYSDIEPSTEGEVIYKVLDPSIHVSDPYSTNIQDLLRITNLRINFTRLHTLGDNLLDRRPDVLQKYYYSIYELVVRGSCFCYGHASECAPVPGVNTRESGMIHGRCVCKHNTVGLNCERCRDFHHDLPWRPAEADNPHTCTECNCNGHSRTCHFDMAVYLATGNVSGGVCDNCLHNTMGRNCETCKPFYYQDPSKDIRDPSASCDCDPVGSLEGGVCDSHTDLDLGMIAGQCRCKPNVKGQRCDYCRDGHYGLTQNDPLGCQPCNCDPRGITMLGAPCDPISGDCSCKRYVTGRYCNQCIPEYWGLSNDLAGCRPCDCDFGGAYSNKCMVENGQCECRSYLIGRQCSEVQPGYFCAALDYYKYEAEGAPDVTTVSRERQPGQMVTWTGPGFARVKDGAGLVFTIDNIAYAMEYDIMIRYEPEVSPELIFFFLMFYINTACQMLIFSETLHRYILMPRPFCFEPSNRYVVSIRFQRHAVSYRHLTAYILVDSLVLIPKYEELPGFQGNDPLAQQRRDEMVRYMCMESFMTAPMPPLAEMCIKLICSISSLMHDGALACRCDPQGSLSTECHKIGGQCSCKPNVIGRNCDQCAPRTYGFGPYGCTACDCHLDGSAGQQCDPLTGQCPCKPGARGRQCSDCQPGHWGFPNCRPCHCNGHAETCDPQTGACLECRDHTAGHLCERCMNGFYGNPVLGSGEHCRPCPCPGNPGSSHSNGDSCHMDHSSNEIICHCKQGYSGRRCELCAPGYFGNPEQAGGVCRPCECNGNIETEDPGSCDSRTGQCLKCLYNTDGPSCSECKIGYYGNALARDCRRCTCMTLGTQQAYCEDGSCDCDRQTGACPCRPNVEGHNCDRCAPNHWNLGMDYGCEACECHPQNSHSSHCNLISGQCQCRQGFGGKQCTECEPLHWGNPNEHCEECRCDLLGSEALQCNRSTGACPCREQASGQHCNECARGFTGNFPKCVPCHPCFQLWDDVVCQLEADLEIIRNKIAGILGMGQLPGFSNTRIHELEEKLAEVQNLLKNGDRDRMHQLIMHSKKVFFFVFPNPDKFEKIQKYYQQSLDAEQRCNASVYGPESPVEQSKQTRNLTETLINQKKDQLLRTVTAQNKSLSELEKKVHDVDKKVHHLSRKVCGGSGTVSANDTCVDDPCGGAGCKKNDSTLICGGPHCNGTVGASLRALEEANNVNKNLTAASKEMMDMEKKVCNVKTQAMNTLEKAQAKKEQFEKSNKKLKDFIQKIRDFLTEEGADPQSIEKIAKQVLAIQLPVNRTVLDQVVEQIKENIANLTDVERAYNQTSEQLNKAKELLNEAQQAKTQAEGVNDAISKTKEALNTTQDAIQKAEKAIETAMENLNSTRNATATVG